MAIITPSNSVSSRLFNPLRQCLADCRHQRSCPELSDFDWLSLGVSRCLQSQTSGRGFLQSLLSMGSVYCPKQSHFFESLKSLRRLRLCFEINQRLVHLANRLLPDVLATFQSIDNFEVYAADGHYHAHATHDAADHEGRKIPCGHIYMRNLRNGVMSHLIALDDIKRRQEHDMHALKRAHTDELRQGAPKGRKVLLVYDRAGIDFAQWWRWKVSAGIYVLTRTKENMALSTMGELPFDERDAINAGVLSDQLVGTGGSSSEVLRRITFFDAPNDRVFEFLTNVNDTSIAPGLLAFLYRKRWDVEKSFDEFKNKLGEKKAWATSANAKHMQAQFLCMTYNLLLLLEHEIASAEGIINAPEIKRRAERVELLKRELGKRKMRLPAALFRVQTMTQRSVKFIRWVLAHLWSDRPWSVACRSLARLYATL